MKKKTKKIAIACMGVIVATIAGIAVYKYMH